MMNDREKERIKRNLERFKELDIINFKDYGEYCSWIIKLGLDEEVLGKDFEENGKYYTKRRVFFNGVYQTIEAICKIELPF